MSIRRSFQRARPVSTPLLEIRVFPRWSHSLFAFNTQATLAPWLPVPAYLTGVFGGSITSGSCSSWSMWSNIYIIVLFACENKGLLKPKPMIFVVTHSNFLSGLDSRLRVMQNFFKPVNLCSLTHSQGIWEREWLKEQTVLMMVIKHLGWQEWKVSGKNCTGNSFYSLRTENNCMKIWQPINTCNIANNIYIKIKIYNKYDI